MSQPSVALLVVSHDGSRWLPTVLDGIRAQTVAPTRVIAIDTGSTDESPQLLRDAFGELHSSHRRQPASGPRPNVVHQ